MRGYRPEELFDDRGAPAAELAALAPRGDRRMGANPHATSRAFDGQIESGDDHVAPDGRVMEVLSEHQCEGWLEGYLLPNKKRCCGAESSPGPAGRGNTSSGSPRYESPAGASATPAEVAAGTAQQCFRITVR
jgi:hypothetical protein